MSKLRVLYISDKVDPLIYSNNIKKRFGDVDLILSAGDLELDYYGFIVSSLNKPLLFVFGSIDAEVIICLLNRNRELGLFLFQYYMSIY